jgi:hypothetical protein
LNTKGCSKIDVNPKHFEIAILKPDKVNVIKNIFSRDKEGHFIIIRCEFIWRFSKSSSFVSLLT